MVSPLQQPLDPATVTKVLLGGQWLAIEVGSFRIGTLRVGAGSSGESIRNDIWFSATLAGEDDRFSGPFSSIQAVRH
ncbi:MAG: hypothetical protein JWO68_3297 [Actinomycetia bacterium]|nr:hypothetical protein [Actinomycetes bacterium]